MLVRSRTIQLAVLALVLMPAGEVMATVQQSTPPGRLRVAILGFTNETGNPEAAHWRCCIERLLSDELRKIKAVKLGGGVEYARRHYSISKDDALESEQARKMGELIEAQRAVWGSYERQNKQWQVRTHVLNVASGKASGELISTSADWFELRNGLTKQILHELGVEPSDSERQKMGRRWTSSPEALEWYSRSCALYDEDKPLSEQQASARKAIAADPKFARAHVALAATLAMKGEFPQAEQAARKALEIRPDYADAHRMIGILSLTMKKYAEAEQALLEAHRLKPDDARTLIRLAELSGVRQKWDEAIAFAEKARLLEPTDASIHAFLGFMYSLKRDRGEAIVELKEAERLDPEGMDVAQRVGQAYERLREIPLALEHYERFVTQVKELGGDPRFIRIFEAKTERLKAGLTPTFIKASMPKMYTDQSLRDALRERLTEDEMAMVVNPIAGSNQMKRWAEQLTEGATSDMDKAKVLFNALAGRIQPGGGHGTRTAREVFAAWDDKDVSFVCQEFAKLFVALARDVNIKAFYVHLERDYKDKVVSHDCAIVFTNDKALLVDPTYRWFGVPHKDFIILDDLQAIAHHFFQHGDSDRVVSRCQMAAKLHPDFAWGQACLGSALCKEGKWDEAHAALDRALQLEPNRWDVFLWLGIISADHDGDLEAATGFVQKALELNPESASAHFVLASVLIRKGKLKEARDEFRSGLRYDPIPEKAEQVRRIISQINEQIGLEHSVPEAEGLGINLSEEDN